MLVSSNLFPDGTKSSTMHTLVLRYGPRHVLVLLPKTYQELLAITCSAFDAAPGTTFVFETSDLDICQDVAVEIHPATWEAIALTVSTVIVKNEDVASHQRTREDGVSKLPYARGKSSVTPKRAHRATSGSSNKVARSENGLGAAATSYDDIQDTLPTDDLAEEELASYDDDFDVTPAPRNGKGKSRSRIEYDEEPGDGDEDGYIEAFPVAKLPASYRSRNAVEPSFSIVPSPPKRVAGSPKTFRGLENARGLFSPVKARSGLVKSSQPSAFSDEDQAESKPSALAFTKVSSDAPPRPGTSNPTPVKETEDDGWSIES
ncbi:hypothetical protein F5148DRAFT_75533 [Russula earlei]|uniref:Uncharacterized protein n=1 Tax=Russula earlei TaxID=71964 RepID=A0ACC0U809_9AGAM|nr:hypothetical protein F5148DRAFT_75533 [Russula earlei]